MSATQYAVDSRDVKFVINEQIGLDRVLSLEAYKDFSAEELNAIVDEAIKQAVEIFGPANAPGDRKGCVRNPDGTVTLPEETVSALKVYRDNGWTSAMADPELGGMGLPHVIGAICGEIFIGSNVAMTMYPGLTRSAAGVIETFCSEDLKKKYVKKMNELVYQGTMCLTEPGAGTAVGDLKTIAKPNGDHYLIEGNKIFISCGENPMTQNVVHLVLARATGSPQGIKGISLFVVPKYLVNDDGSNGEYNDVMCTGIEHKMGINASATCQLTFGANGKCRGYLVGEINQGIVYMFQMMNEARLSVGLQGVGVANAAYQSALAYAKERVQGVSVENFKDPNAPRVTIIEHPDVSRMLMFQKAIAEGGRAMACHLALWTDFATHAEDADEKRRYKGLLDLCTPIIKAYYTDYGYLAATAAVQTYGGYGYTKDYPAEQYVRDVKISSIYEGTNGVQAMDLLGRKMAQGGGMLFMGAMSVFNEFQEKNAGDPVVGPMIKSWGEAKEKLAETAMNFGQMAMGGEFGYPMAYSVPFLNMFGHLFNAYFLMDQARVAAPKLEKLVPGWSKLDAKARKAKMAGNDEAKFYHGKVMVASYFVNQVLPEVHSLARSIASGDRSTLEMVW